MTNIEVKKIFELYKNNSGFTLIEIVLMIIILGVIGFVISISIGDINSTKLNSAARRLASDIRYAQQLAMTKQIRHGVVFNSTFNCAAAPDTYTVFEEKGACVDTPARNPTGGGDFIVNYNTDAQFQGVAITASNFCTGIGGTPPCTSTTLEFNSLGVPTDAAGTPLTSGSVTLSYSGNSKTLTIEPNTGKLS